MENHIEIENEKKVTMWRGRIRNNRDKFHILLEKIKTVEGCNSREVIGIFMNPTRNYLTQNLRVFH
ncbi:MAG: hypothetical protein QXP36_02795 [Conexivisphaerales archaeon]